MHTSLGMELTEHNLLPRIHAVAFMCVCVCGQIAKCCRSLSSCLKQSLPLVFTAIHSLENKATNGPEGKVRGHVMQALRLLQHLVLCPPLRSAIVYMRRIMPLYPDNIFMKRLKIQCKPGRVPIFCK